jgi:hypothetical protein
MEVYGVVKQSGTYRFDQAWGLPTNIRALYGKGFRILDRDKILVINYVNPYLDNLNPWRE